MPKRRRKKKASAARPAATSKTGMFRLPQQTLWFVFVSVLDYFMTYLVLYYSHQEGGELRDRLVESNPFAGYFIDRWGLEKGLLGFKLGLVVAICLITQRIAVHQPRTARWVLNAGTLVTGIVVIYSVNLLMQALG